MGSLRDADELIAPAVEQTIDTLELQDADRAAVQLARRYAALIDEQTDPKLRAWALRWIGPLLLSALESLGATPAARARLKGGRTPDAAPNRLDDLRRARASSRPA